MSEEHNHQHEDMGQLPPAEFLQIMQILAIQSQGAMGLLQDPDGQHSEVNLPIAKHFIDLIVILNEKSKGNLSEEESKIMEEVIAAMQMQYVKVSEDDKPKSKIIIP
jgi:hypothetical protein